jgi:alpha-1,6-mannosyltransferase
MRSNLSQVNHPLTAPVTLASKYYITSLLPRKPARDLGICLFLLTSSAILFRAELFLLLYGVIATRLLTSLPPANSNVSLPVHWIAVLRTMAPSIVAAFVVALPLTLGLDTLLWPPHKPSPWPLWPEAYGFLYNAVAGNASNWGTSPWHFYITSAIPRLLLNPLACVLLFIPLMLPLPLPKDSESAAPSTKPVTSTIMMPLMMFVGFYSWLGHKEWRFIVYVVPSLTAAAAAGANALWNLPKNELGRTIGRFALVQSIMISFAFSAILLLASSLNYPGGTGLYRLKGYIDSGAAFHSLPGHSTKSAGIEDIKPHAWNVYADNLACQTGVTRFLADDYTSLINTNSSGLATHELHIVKSDTPEEFSLETWNDFDFALVEKPERVIGNWEVLDIVWGFGGVEIVRPGSSQQEEEEEDDEFSHDPLSLETPESSIDVKAALKERASGSRARREMGLVLEERPVDKFIGQAIETIADIWGQLENLFKDRLLRGTWVRGKMKPKIWILRREGLA